MSLVSKAIRSPANRQKILHESEPTELRRRWAAKQCHCGQWFSLPCCHADRHMSCTAECAQRLRDAEAKKRERKCTECSALFIPRLNQARNGGGRFCSIKCGLVATRRTDAFKLCGPKRVASRRASYVPRKPEDNPRWKGGQAAYRKRRQECGDGARQLREYRKANPHKTREWQQNRKNRKAGRMEYGTIPKLMDAQRGMCAYCRCDIRDNYHVDHIVPLAKGGRHAAENVQLLCPSCNLHKSDRDPIAFAQMCGRLI